MAMKSAKAAYIWLTEELGKKVNFLTNGTLMPDEWAERLCRGSTWLYFSVNGVERETYERINAGGRFELVKKNIQKVRETRDRLGSSLVLVGHFTMVPENMHEVNRFPQFGKEVGFDRVEFGYDLATVPRWLTEHPQEKQRLRQSFAETLARPPIEIRTSRLGLLGLTS